MVVGREEFNENPLTLSGTVLKDRVIYTYSKSRKNTMTNMAAYTDCCLKEIYYIVYYVVHYIQTIYYVSLCFYYIKIICFKLSLDAYCSCAVMQYSCILCQLTNQEAVY